MCVCVCTCVRSCVLGVEIANAQTGQRMFAFSPEPSLIACIKYGHNVSSLKPTK